MIGAACIIAMNVDTAGADEGETIFKSQGCIVCHKKESSSKVNPSLTEIQTAYQGKPEQLIKFLNGESEAVVRPQKASIMKRYIKRTKALSNAERKALAEYILGQQ
jgi:cytochrome c551/c552